MIAAQHLHGRYRLGDYELCCAAWELRHGETLVVLGPSALTLLEHLVLHAHRFVARSELHALLWGDTHVQDGSISQLVWQLRRALGDSPRDARWIRTLRGRGYRYVGPPASPLPEGLPSNSSLWFTAPHAGGEEGLTQ